MSICEKRSNNTLAFDKGKHDWLILAGIQGKCGDLKGQDNGQLINVHPQLQNFGDQCNKYTLVSFLPRQMKILAKDI